MVHGLHGSRVLTDASASGLAGRNHSLGRDRPVNGITNDADDCL